MGTPLFDRSTNPIQLTDCGKEYVKCMEKILDIENGFENYLNHMNELKTGRLSIGGSNFFTSFVLPPIVSRYMQKYPFIQISLIEANTSQLEQQLISGVHWILSLTIMLFMNPSTPVTSCAENSFFWRSQTFCIQQIFHKLQALQRRHCVRKTPSGVNPLRPPGSIPGGPLHPSALRQRYPGTGRIKSAAATASVQE